MNQDTPAIEIKAKDLAANTEALSNLLPYITGSIKRVWDIRYGLGGWAKLVREAFPECTVKGFEQDPQTAGRAWKDDGVELIVGRFLALPAIAPSLVLADFNTLTVLKRSLLDELIQGKSKPKFIIFTDVCCSKLHLNFKSYGLNSPDLKEYWTKFKVEGYQLVKFVKVHHAASTALYKKFPVG